MRARRWRGEPLWALGTVLAIWVGLRVLFWAPDDGGARAWAAVPVAGLAAVRAGVWDDDPPLGPSVGQAIWRAVRAVMARPRGGLAAVRAPVVVPAGPLADGAALIAGHGVSGALAPSWSAVEVAPVGEVALAAPARVGAKRWSGDGWALWRRGGIGLDRGAILPAYGASQTGAVVRFRLDPGSRHPVDVYARGSVALVMAPGAPGREADIALGVIAQPFAGVPVKVAVEARGSSFDDESTHLRPAVMAVSAVPPLALPLGARAEVYAAAGYVGGAAATGFVDGQLRVDRAVGRVGDVSLRAGAGAWGGAQQGVGRLDVGPTASLGFRVGEVAARLAVDWRVKVAGNATPGSGPAVTLAAGF